MIWLLQRNTDILTCEIRESADSTGYEFEVASVRGPIQSLTFESATDLIRGFLAKQDELQALGWRPRPASNTAELSVAQ